MSAEWSFYLRLKSSGGDTKGTGCHIRTCFKANQSREGIVGDVCMYKILDKNAPTGLVSLQVIATVVRELGSVQTPIANVRTGCLDL